MVKIMNFILLIFGGLFLIVFISGWWFFHYKTLWKTMVSPCGKYKVEAYVYQYQYYMPCSPGNGSDKSGCVYVKRIADGKTLLSADLPFVWMVNGLKWETIDGEYYAEVDFVFCIILEPKVKIIYDSNEPIEP